MKKTIILVTISAFALLLFTNCSSKNSSSKKNCSESEAFKFAKGRIENAMKVSASNTISSSDENCVYTFYFEGLNNYNQCVENRTTVKYSDNNWTVLDSQFSDCR